VGLFLAKRPQVIIPSKLIVDLVLWPLLAQKLPKFGAVSDIKNGS
jgi:hypothetical protein